MCFYTHLSTCLHGQCVVAPMGVCFTLLLVFFFSLCVFVMSVRTFLDREFIFSLYFCFDFQRGVLKVPTWWFSLGLGDGVCAAKSPHMDKRTYVCIYVFLYIHVLLICGVWGHLSTLCGLIGLTHVHTQSEVSYKRHRRDNMLPRCVSVCVWKQLMPAQVRDVCVCVFSCLVCSRAEWRV